MKIGHAAAVIAILLVSIGACFLAVTHDSGPETAIVSVMHDDGIGLVVGDGEYTEGADVTLQVVVKEGFVLDGWYDYDGNLVSKETTVKLKAENVSFLVKTLRNVSVCLAGDYGVVSTSGSGTYTVSDDIYLDCVLKPGFQFRGWYGPDGRLLSDRQSAAVHASVLKNSEATVTAKSFSEQKVTLKVSYDPGVDSVTGQGVHSLGEPVELSLKLVPGYHIVGWYGPDGVMLGDDDRITVYAEDKTIRAVTERNGQISLELHTDGGIRKTYTDEELYEGTRVTFGAELNPGYSFDGWYDRNGNMYSKWQWTEITANKDLVLYAKTVHEYTHHALGSFGLNASGKKVVSGGDDGSVFISEGSIGCFLGWYDLDGNRLSGSHTFYPSEHDGVFIAKSDIDCYEGDNILIVEDYPDWYDRNSYCIILDGPTKKYIASFKYRSCPDIRLADGTYDICYYNGLFDRGAEYTVQEKTFGKEHRYNLYWNFEGRNYGMYWNLGNGMFDRYRDSAEYRHTGGGDVMRSLCDYTDGIMTETAEYLETKCTGMDENQRANFYLKFVQLTTQYELDTDYNGHSEYYKHPVMTLLESRGDCEDTAILYATLMKAAGFQVMLLEFTGEGYEGMGHEAAAVRLDHLPGGTYYDYDGGKYYYCETTSDYKNVGDEWDQYDRAKLYPVL